MIDRHLVKQGLVISRQEAERRLNAVFQQTYQMLLMMDVDGRVSEANNTALELGGWAMEAIKGKLLFDLTFVDTQEIDKVFACKSAAGRGCTTKDGAAREGW